LIPYLELKNITKYYKGMSGSKKLIFDNLSFLIYGEDNIVSIYAPFGGGKTTILKILSGLDNDYLGEILINGKKIRHKFPYIPEKPSSFPWLNVSANIKLIIEMHGKNVGHSNIYLQELIKIVGLNGYEDHFPFNNSYGFRFRISLARALAVSPPLILIDDSFKLMDAETKNEIFELIKTIASVEKIKFIIASSDIKDVALLSNKILLIDNKPDSLSTEIEIDNYYKEWKG
jgi:ABC-type nitrate/sulfonate/bicarbonate transport system ATPase subunit